LITIEDRSTGTKAVPRFYTLSFVVGGDLMIVADIYRGYAAECIDMSRRRENVKDKALLVQMATMWLHLAELAERPKGTEDSLPTV
jgi:hypothetical protein